MMWYLLKEGANADGMGVAGYAASYSSETTRVPTAVS